MHRGLCASIWLVFAHQIRSALDITFGKDHFLIGFVHLHNSVSNFLISFV
jgi:hypothetical protein